MAKKFQTDINMDGLDIINAITGLTLVNDSVIATDTIKQAIGKLQGQIDVWTELITANTYNNSSGSVLQNVTELGIPVTAGKTYRLEITLAFQSGATNRGLVITVGSTDGALGTIALTANILTGTDGTGGLHSGAITSLGDLVVSTSVQAANTDYICQIIGVFRCTTSGTIYPQFRASTNGTNQRISPGSVILSREF